MRHGKKVLALLLMLALLASLGATALADDGEDAVIVAEEVVIEGETENETKGEPETEEKLTVKCVDAEGKTIRDKKEDYLDLSKDLVVDEKYTRPEIENYTYQKMKVGEDEIEKLTVTHKDGKAVITVTIGEGEEAKERGIAVRTAKALTGANGKCLVEESESGYVKLVADAESGVIVGAQLVCPRATDLVAELALAISLGCTARQLAAVIHPHPTVSELISDAARTLA